jgi:hypothetical protein
MSDDTLFYADPAAEDLRRLPVVLASFVEQQLERLAADPVNLGRPSALVIRSGQTQADRRRGGRPHRQEAERQPVVGGWWSPTIAVGVAKIGSRTPSLVAVVAVGRRPR